MDTYLSLRKLPQASINLPNLSKSHKLYAHIQTLTNCTEQYKLIQFYDNLHKPM